ncbi:MAG: hypothetical protein ABS69_04560 [Nitrosomonadales bacterium SCN 54-20]|nr:MAG: hypothetical protein ABS69_04560 [Nitrosomonadales bacterium SCN 54-20]
MNRKEWRDKLANAQTQEELSTLFNQIPEATGTIDPVSKQYKRHASEGRDPVTFKVRHYWFGLDSGSSPKCDEIHSISWPDQ